MELRGGDTRHASGVIERTIHADARTIDGDEREGGWSARRSRSTELAIHFDEPRTRFTRLGGGANTST
jgi:hypothetical protein